MSGRVRKVILAAALSLLANQTVSAQTADNLITNPNMDAEGPDGPSTAFSGIPPRASIPFIFHIPAAAAWGLRVLTYENFSIETELMASDLVPGGRMLHVRASNVGLISMSPYLTSTPALPTSFGFCVWIKVVHGGKVAAGLYGATTDGNHSGAWQPIIVNQPNAISQDAGFGVFPFATLDRTLPRLGEVEFYLQAATLAAHPLTACPQQTLNSLAGGRQRLNLPPQYPVIEHPQWTGASPLATAPYGQGAITPAFVPGPITPPPPPSNAPTPAVPSNAPGGKK